MSGRLTVRLELEPVQLGAPGHECYAWVHECGHLEWWPVQHPEGSIQDQGCDACESSPTIKPSWRRLYAYPPGHIQNEIQR